MVSHSQYVYNITEVGDDDYINKKEQMSCVTYHSKYDHHNFHSYTNIII
jgi:hypothetical protein